MAVLEDLRGRVFGRLTVTERAKNNPHGGAQWLCKCFCGNTTEVGAGNLKTGHVTSCRCLHREIAREVNTRHNMCGTKEYSTWGNMKDRCTNPKNKRYATYAGMLCEEWMTFEGFYADMGKAPSPTHTVDRKENSKGYNKDNCRWATQREQQNNRTNNAFHTHNGETLTLAQWSRRVGASSDAIYMRIKRGWTLEDALTKPFRKDRRRA